MVHRVIRTVRWWVFAIRNGSVPVLSSIRVQVRADAHSTCVVWFAAEEPAITYMHGVFVFFLYLLIAPSARHWQWAVYRARYVQSGYVEAQLTPGSDTIDSLRF